MPFTRSITSCFLFVILLIAIVGPGNHPWFTDETLWLAVLFAFCVWLMSLKRDFFLDVVSILFAGFFLQRIVVIYFRPDQMGYQEGHLIFSSQVFDEAIMFCTATVIAILIGYFMATHIRKDIQKQKRLPININFDRLFGNKFNLEHYFKIYSLFLYVAIFFKIFLIVKFNVGLTSVVFDRQLAPLLRITQIICSLQFLPILVLASGKFSASTRKTALRLTVLILIYSIFFATSKGTLLSLCMAFFVCLYFSGRRISKKYAIIGGIILVFTMFTLAPIATILRSGLMSMATRTSSFSDVLLLVLNNYTLIFDQLFFSFMNRLGGFDCLTGFMTAGRDAFLACASLYSDVITIINSLVPGDLIDRAPDYVPISKLMPHILRGWILGTYPSHGENMGGAGMSYLYFGKVGGTLFFFIWSFISVKILNSNSNVIIKVMFFSSFVFSFFIGGYLVTAIKHFYEGVILIIIGYFVSQIIRSKPYRRSHPFAGRTNSTNSFAQ